MESLDESEWDVIICGTGLTQSLLALSLSRSGKRILHLDRNDYYGDNEAAFSLSEAEAWASRFSSTDDSSTFSHASVTRPNEDGGEGMITLSSSRAYSLALAPQLIYSRSTLLPALVSSRTHNQLDFQAVGSWFTVSTGSQTQPTLIRVPSGREDVFQDTTFDLRAKRSLMKFLRFVANYEEQSETWQEDEKTPFPAFLESKFGLPAASHSPIMALTMSQQAPQATTTEMALPKVARHLRSIGVFGPGFGAVLPKWGGLAEITQVACRACAVGGGVYVLNKGIKNVDSRNPDGGISVELAEGEKVSTTWLVGSRDELSLLTSEVSKKHQSMVTCTRSISIISSPLTALFPPTSEGGVIPAGAVVVVPASSEHEPPVHILVHTSEAGECPMNQCVLYSSITLPPDHGFERLQQAIETLLKTVGEVAAPRVLWTLQYQQQTPTSPSGGADDGDGFIVLPPLSLDLTIEDSVLDSVKEAWQKITGAYEAEFMRFEAREGVDDDEEI